MGIIKTDLAIAGNAILFLLATEYLLRNRDLAASILRRPLWFRIPAYSLGLWVILVFGVFVKREFIYFTF